MSLFKSRFSDNLHQTQHCPSVKEQFQLEQALNEDNAPDRRIEYCEVMQSSKFKIHSLQYQSTLTFMQFLVILQYILGCN